MPKTIRKCLADMLEDLSKSDFDKFCRQLVDRQTEPRVRRGRVEGKNFLDIAELLVTTFTERGAVQVAVDLLREIECNNDAEQLLREVSGLSSNPGASVTAGPSAVASGGTTMTDDEHFVDKYRLQLISRVTNLNPILDELLHHKVINQETYETIRALPTSGEKMRALYSGCLRAATRCKDIFYQILEKEERFLIEDIKTNQ